jgi:hypothetical protein
VQKTNPGSNGINMSKSTPRDFFLNLLSFVAMYVSVIVFIVLIHQYINVGFEDPLESSSYFYTSLFETIRWSTSMLIVFFPVFLWISVILGKDLWLP